MRQKRAKAYRKLMSLYGMTFGFRQPYQVLADSDMCKAAIDHKIELVKQLGTVLQGNIKPMITQCCIHELYLQGTSHQPAVDLAKTFERRKCNHREPIPGDDCLSSVVGSTNKHRYVIATQSQPLRVKLRNIPAVPIVHINRTVMVLEPPSDLTIKTKEALEEKALHLTAPDKTLVASSVTTESLCKRKKGPKGPNPLSVKKKKPTAITAPEKKGNIQDSSMNPPSALTGEKRKRHNSDTHNPTTGCYGDLVDNLPQPTKKRRRKTVIV